MHNIETLVYCEIEDRLNKMSNADPTSDVYKATSDTALKLIDRAIKMEETEIQAKAVEQKARELELQAEANKLKERELEEANRLKELEIKEAHKSGVRDIFVQGVKIVVPPLIVVAAAFALTNYERTDIVAGTAGKEIWKHVFRLI